MKRTGLMHSFVVALIIVLVAFLIILGIAIRIGFIANEDTDTNVCRVTLAAQDLSKVGIDGLKKDSPLVSSCKRRTIDITDTGVYLVKNGEQQSKIPVYVRKDGKLSRTTSYDLTGKGGEPEDILASQFAESLRRCWLRGLEGDVKVFNDRSMVSQQTVCMLCDETHVQIASTVQGPWLTGYVGSTPMPQQPERKYGEYLYDLKDENRGGSTYANLFELFAGTSSPVTWFWPGITADSRFTRTAQTICLAEGNINPNPVIRDGSYATVFFRSFSKKDDGCMAVAVVPAEQVRTLCDYVAN